MKTLFNLLGKLLIAFSFLLAVQKASAQTNTFPSTGSAGIGTITPNASSVLDMVSSTQGVLLPRMTSTQRNAIVSPATGLLIYQTNSTPGLYYYSGSAWTAVTAKGANTSLSNLAATVAVNQSLLPNATGTLNLGSTSLKWNNVFVNNLDFGDGTIQTTAFIPYTSGTGISITGNVISNTGGTVTSITAGSGLTGGTITTSGTIALGSSGVTAGTYGSSSFIPVITIDSKGRITSATTAATSASNANLTLSNLSSPTSINQALLPSSSNTNDIGSSSLTWKNLYLEGKLYMGGNVFLDNSGSSNTWVGNTGNTVNTGSSNTAVGSSALHSNTSGTNNTASGDHALYSVTGGSRNVAIGDNTLYTTNNNSYNIAIGDSSLYSYNDGSGLDYMVAIGKSALRNNSYGGYNTAIGAFALYKNTTGAQNTASGYQALYTNVSANQNTATGYQALYLNSGGSYNTANGFWALYTNASGANNTAVGYKALHNTLTDNNTALGYLAGDVNAATNSTFVGSSAQNNAGSFSNTTVVGYSASGTASNQVRIGNSSVTSIGGYADWSNISDGRFKRNIRNNVPGLEFINKLKPVTYSLDVNGIDNKLHPEPLTQNGQSEISDETKKLDETAREEKSKIVYSGFIAQEVEASAKEISYDFSGVDAPKNDNDLYGLRYAEFVVPLVKAVQELSDANDKLKTQNEELSNRISTLEEKSAIQNLPNSSGQALFEMNDGFARLSFTASSEITLLGQNIPNPFDNSTLIPFRVPKDCKDASIMITNTSTSEVISVIPISCNEDHVSIDAGTLASGTYSYSLYVDGKMIDTKQMVLTK